MKNNLLNPYVRGLSDGAYAELHMEAERTKTPSVEPDVGMFLEYFTYTSKPAQILELGCGIGVSTRYMLKGAPDAQVTAVDYNAGRLGHAQENVKGDVRFVTSDVLDFLKNDNSMYDMIFVDSMKKQYPMVFHYAYHRLRSGGTIIFDDIFMYGEVFCEDCEISPKYISAVRTLRDFIKKIQLTHRHTLLPIGGGVMLVGK